MAKMDIAIDLGTSFTSIFVAGNGVVLREPSAIAYFTGGNKQHLRAVGYDAYDMIGKAPEKTKVVCPIADGIIKDPDAAAAMLGEFIKLILPQSYIKKPRIRAIIGVPTGITVEERKMYEDVVMRAAVDEVVMVNSIMLSAIGIDLPIDATYGGFIASIGGGLTEIAVISLCGIVKGCSINIGGDMIDRTLIDSIHGIYSLKLDLNTVRDIKDKIASLIRNDRASVKVAGIDTSTKNIKEDVIAADRLYGAIYVYYANIMDAIESVINSCSPSVVGEIRKNGIHIVGGGAKIPGLERVMSDRLGISVHVAQDPQYATVVGAGKLISDPYLIEDIIYHA